MKVLFFSKELSFNSQIPATIIDGGVNTYLVNDYLRDNKDIASIITIGNDLDCTPLNELPFEYRKMWVHFEEYNFLEVEGAIIGTITYNIQRVNNTKFFSIFTSTYNTKKSDFERLYNSLQKQTYPHWNWWIIDDSEDTPSYLTNTEDPRIHVIKNVTQHGNIGFNKHTIAMCCDGDYLLEVDHDDELVPECLETIYNAFEKYPDADFAYSDTLELIDENVSVNYGKNFSLGQGYTRNERIGEWNYKICVTCPSINCKSIRSIFAAPNHIRCWKKDFYHKIGGHDTTLALCDDLELCIRTFLNTRMIHIDKVLYIQYEYGRNLKQGNNTQTKNEQLIAFLNYVVYNKYDKQIHDRILELGFEDQIWIEEEQRSDVYKSIKRENIIDLGYQYK